MQKLADLADLKEGRGHLVLLPNGREIALFKVKGEVYALGNSCPHMDGPLAEGKVDSEHCSVTCPWHDWRFDLKTGICLNQEEERAKKISIEVRDGAVFLVPK